MRALTYYVAVSIDGFVAGPEGQFDAFGFPEDLAAWIVEEHPETLPAPARAALGIADRPPVRFDTVVMGRRTFDPALAAGMTSAYPHLRQVVVSRSLPADQPEVEVVAGDAAAVVRKLKATDGLGIWLCGGGDLAGQLRDEIDELVLKRNPLLLGSGVPLFGPRGYAPEHLRLVEARRFASGVVVEHYARG